MGEKGSGKEEKDFSLVPITSFVAQLKGSEEFHCSKKTALQGEKPVWHHCFHAKNPNLQYCILVCAQFPHTLTPFLERRRAQSHCRKHQGMWQWCEWQRVHSQAGHVLSLEPLWKKQVLQKCSLSDLVRQVSSDKNKLDFLKDNLNHCVYPCSINLKFGYMYPTPGDRWRWTIFIFRKFLNNNRIFSFFWLTHDAANVPWFHHVWLYQRTRSL